MRLRNAGLLSIAVCFYFVGAPILDSFSGVVPFAASMDMVIVGLFLGLMPRWEGAVFYLFAACVDAAQILVDVPYDQAKFSAVVGAAQVASRLGSAPAVFGYVIPEWLVVGVVFLVIGGAAALLIRFLFSLLKSGKTVVLLFAVSTIPLFVGGWLLLQPIIASPELVLENSVIVSEVMVNCSAFLNLYIVFSSPFLAYYFFKWLGVYRRVPRVF